MRQIDIGVKLYLLLHVAVAISDQYKVTGYNNKSRYQGSAAQVSTIHEHRSIRNTHSLQMHILLNSIDADMKSEIGSSRVGLRPYPLRFHVREAGVDAKLIQHGPLLVTYHFMHPVSTVLVASITDTTRCPVKTLT